MDKNIDKTIASGAKGSVTGEQVAGSGMATMLDQLQQVLAQITQTVDVDNSKVGDEERQQLMDLANQLAANLQEQGDEVGEPSMYLVLQIIDAVADMLDSGQLSISQ